jgi:hypothetical protein
MGIKSESCIDFRLSSGFEANDEDWCPDGYMFVLGQLVKRSPLRYENNEYVPRLTRMQQWEILESHPLFTGICPACGNSYSPNIELIHWDCESCGWKDDSI